MSLQERVSLPGSWWAPAGTASMEEMVASVEASETEIITVAIRRLDLDDTRSKGILDYLDWTKYTILPNTAGCKTPEEALTTARLARAMGLSGLGQAGSAAGCQISSSRSLRHAESGGTACQKKGLPCCPTYTPTQCWHASWKRWAAPP